MILAVALLCMSISPALSAYEQSSERRVDASTNSELPFTDVYRTDWFYDAVSGAYNAGLMLGTSNTTFSPNENISIAQALTMATRIHSSHVGSAALTNASGNNWYDTYVDYAINNRMIGTYDFSDYNSVATRAQMAYIFSSVIPAEKQTTTSNRIPPDVKESDTYGREIYLLYRTGILVGSDHAGTFSPTSSITRAEAATIILRVHLLLADETTPTPTPPPTPMPTPTPTPTPMPTPMPTPTPMPMPTPMPTPTLDTSSFARDVLDLVNVERTQNGCSPLTWDDGLATLAQEHSVDMVERGFFDHTNPDGLSPFDRMRIAGISFGHAAENIAAGQRTPEAVVNAWMNSTGHRANILNPNLTHIGVGFHNYYWTQVFASFR